MRLLHTKKLEVKEFIKPPQYAILSHTWQGEEVTFHDIADLSKARLMAGFAKIKGACDLAASQNFDYIWIDTCCIDKSSSAELGEAINSMFGWYQWSAVCYAYLSDVQEMEDVMQSRWFTRGWTLQELIAPLIMEFYSVNWTILGSKKDREFRSLLSRASHVDEPILLYPRLMNHIHQVSVARKMYWASSRITTRIEDEAYCLMGLFGVNMPLIYGEGHNAFRRLQEEIINNSQDVDDSILAWYNTESQPQLYSDILAYSPKSFSLSGDISLGGASNPFPFNPQEPMSITSQGIKQPLLIFRGDIDNMDDGCGTRHFQPFPRELRDECFTDDETRFLAILNCQVGPIPGVSPVLFVSPHQSAYRRVVIRGQDMLRFSLHDVAYLASSQYDLHKSIIQTISTIKDTTPIYLKSTPSCRCHCSMEDVNLKRHTRTVAGPGFEHINTTDASAPRDLFQTFWLVPLDKPASKVTITVSNVFPPEDWDPICLRLVKTIKSRRINHRYIATESRIHGAVALDLKGASDRKVGRVTLIFGRFPLEQGMEYDGWCCLISHNDDREGPALSQLLEMDTATWAPLKPDSALELEPGVVLKATMRETTVGREDCDLIRLWVDSNTDVDGEEGKDLIPTSP
ncbi:heterokaryon incompatibility protein-domain-containing protein [Bombardia bombarda]|uniref:Heterokaryon incompatibility protein-domain-containing protein n=1 Tax=Bombardia bombarda TaxID=252184 RepID=A0AA39TGA3_9PEZI|nr:heterokaryon incompatibility protein-domain-containing protein [Bombardia bombarda]